MMRVEGPAMCEFLGTEPGQDEVMPCGRPAEGFVRGPEGRKVYACRDHITQAKLLARSGSWERLVVTLAPRGGAFA